MELPRELISNFAKITASKTQPPSEVITYGTAYKVGESYFVKLDGAADGTLTPVASTVEVSDGERVTVMIKNHMATITGNFSEPAAKNSDVVEAQTNIEEAQSDIEEVQQNKVEKTEVINSINETEETALISAERIDVANLFAKNITATGDIFFNNSKYMIKNVNGDEETNERLVIRSANDLALSGERLVVMSTDGIYLYDDGDKDILISTGGDVLLRAYDYDCVQVLDRGGVNRWTVINTGNINRYLNDYTGNTFKDYVVERGSGGGDSYITWKYRKWNSGAVELWGRRKITNRACTTLFGGGMYQTSEITTADFPFDAYYPNVQVTYEPSDGYGALVWPTSAATKDAPGKYYLMRPTIPKDSGGNNVTLDGYLNFYVRASLTA